MGEVFAGRYELIDPIGRGGVGAVWRAWDHRRRRYVAAKVLQQSDAHALLRFVREQALRIDHPHVLAPASWAADDDKVLFTMDLVAGGSLVHLVGDYGPLPPAFVCTLLDQLLSGLAAVHAEGVVHRDIKPANILLEATGTARPRLRLSDFGIAMRLGEPRLTETNYVVGTPGYLAPEQLMGEEPDFPADLFAVGLVALYLLEGAKPDAKALIEYFVAHGTPGAPRSIPEPLWQVVATLIQPDPTARFRTATGARKALAAAAELLPEPGPDDELVEIFDQLGPLPTGFGPEGPLRVGSGPPTGTVRTPEERGGTSSGTVSGDGAYAGAGYGGGGVPSGTATADGAFGGGALPSATPSGIASADIGSGGIAASGSAPSNGASHGTAPRGPATNAGPLTGSDGWPQSPTGGASEAPHGGSAPPRHTTGAIPPQPDSGSHSASGAVSQAPPPSAGPPGPNSTAVPLNSAVVPPRPAVAPPVAPPASAPRVIPPKPALDPTPPRPTPPQPSSMSDTGSFHLPPPQAQPATPQALHEPQRRTEQPPAPPTAVAAPAPMAPAHTPHPEPTHVPSPRTPAAQTAAVQQHAFASTGSYTARSAQVPTQPQAISRRRRKRPGPPVKVAVPVLFLALACFAVGFWALTQI